MHLNIVDTAIIFILTSCNGGSAQKATAKQDTPNLPAIASAATVGTIPLPESFARIAQQENTFAAWLREIKLKKDNTVYLFDGRVKANQDAQFAVLDISVGDKNLQQCADAIMRLRAEYFFSRKEFTKIGFKDNNGVLYQFDAPYTRQRFMTYLEKVFGMCGTASLSKQLLPVAIKKMQVGDVLIRGGFPGHAVIVVDMAENATGKKIFLLAQSYMPAQDIHILKNVNSGLPSPWYTLLESKNIFTPEYHFTNHQLKTWW